MFSRRRGMHLTMGAVGALTALLVLVSGCSTLPPQTTQVTYFQQCYQPIQVLRNQEKDLQMSTAGGAVIGAVGGAVLGYLITGKAQGAVAGAVAGGLAGGVAGYALQKQQQIKDDRLRYASYQQDMAKDIEKLDKTLIAARQAQKCYDEQFNHLVTLVKGKHITKAEAQKRFEEIQQGSNEVAAILGQVSSQANERATQYQDALAAEAKKADVTVDEIMLASKPAPEKAAAPTPPPTPAPAPEKATKPAKTAAKAKAAPKAKQEPKVAEAPPAAQPVAQPAAKINPKLQDKSELVAMGQAQGQFQNKKQEVEMTKAELEANIQDSTKKFELLMTGA